MKTPVEANRAVWGFRVFWILCLFSWAVYGQQESETPSTDMRSFSFSLIRVPVWVTDNRGEAPLQLKAEDFRMLVDGREVAPARCSNVWVEPLELVYLVDVSGSMDVGGKLEGSLQTLDYLLKRHRSEDRWRIAAFSDGQVVQVLDHEQAEHWGTLRPKFRAYGKTALFDALSLGEGWFHKDSLHNRAILLFTDGNDNQSILTESQLYETLKALNFPVFIVGIADGFVPTQNSGREKLGLKTLEEITKISGGELFIASDSSQLPQIGRWLEQRLRPQYLLTFMVERGARERRRTIEVQVKGRSDLQIRHRSGYIGLEPEYRGGSQ